MSQRQSNPQDGEEEEEREQLIELLPNGTPTLMLATEGVEEEKT